MAVSLAGDNVLDTKLPDPYGDGRIWYTEHDRTGRRIRQVQVEPDGTMMTTTQADWPLNPRRALRGRLAAPGAARLLPP